MRNCKFIILISLVVLVAALPVTPPKKPNEHPKDKEQPVDDVVLEYERYLKEVVEALESDPEFRRKLDKAPEADIRSGKIAQELEYVSHNVRSKLDEIKRREIDRLRDLVRQQYELTNNIDNNHLKIGEHVHHENAHTFEIEDLKKLILKAASDIAEADQKRREEFKQYELQKEFEKQEKLKSLDEQHKKDYEAELEKQKQNHSKHEKLHHPGNKAQLEEVWEKQDHMEGLDFDPKMFFKMHDLDGNGYWDEIELKALFKSNLDKAYQSGMPEVDLRERAEEMERMREHVFAESDKNRDGLISYDEFLQQTYNDQFNKDPEWETIDNNPQFTHEEYLAFERKRQEEIQRLIAQGSLPPGNYHPQYQGNRIDQNVPEMHYQQQNQHQQQQQQYHQQQQQYQQHHQQQQPYQQQQQYQQYPQQNNQQYQPQYQQPPPQQNNQQPPPQKNNQQPPPQQQNYQQPPPQQQTNQQYQPQQQQQVHQQNPPSAEKPVPNQAKPEFNQQPVIPPSQPKVPSNPYPSQAPIHQQQPNEYQSINNVQPPPKQEKLPEKR